MIRTLGLPICFAVLATAPASLAQQGPTAEDRASARVLGTEGTRLADANNCAGAVPKLDAAEKLFHAPTTLDRLGECQIALGQIVAGTENLNRVVREVLPANSPPAFVAAQKRAQQAYTAAVSRIGSLRIHVDGVAVDQVTVTVDGVSVPTALFDNSRPTDPGSHEVKATAPGYLSATATASLKDGGDTSVALHRSAGSERANGAGRAGSVGLGRRGCAERCARLARPAASRAVGRRRQRGGHRIRSSSVASGSRSGRSSASWPWARSRPSTRTA